MLVPKDDQQDLSDLLEILGTPFVIPASFTVVIIDLSAFTLYRSNSVSEFSGTMIVVSVFRSQE